MGWDVDQRGAAMSPTVYRESLPYPRTSLRVHPERAVPDEAPAILAAGLVAHVGFMVDGQPYVIPMSYHFDPAEPGRLYLHGPHAGRLMTVLREGTPVCITVTLLDGLVYSRTALYHSMNYRSVVGFGRAGETPSPEIRATLLEAMIGRYFPGRTAGRDYASAPAEHLDATAFIAVEIEEWSAKARRGGPKGPRDADPIAPGTAGVVQLGMLGEGSLAL
jgi:nitroimidazol reductase NimA-like FMN-containing flavoprotein (pyridoxamine 5'-phosphate oxidase superfamily)